MSTDGENSSVTVFPSSFQAGGQYSHGPLSILQHSCVGFLLSGWFGSWDFYSNTSSVPDLPPSHNTCFFLFFCQSVGPIYWVAATLLFVAQRHYTELFSEDLVLSTNRLSFFLSDGFSSICTHFVVRLYRPLIIA